MGRRRKTGGRAFAAAKHQGAYVCAGNARRHDPLWPSRPRSGGWGTRSFHWEGELHLTACRTHAASHLQPGKPRKTRLHGGVGVRSRGFGQATPGATGRCAIRAEIMNGETVIAVRRMTKRV